MGLSALCLIFSHTIVTNPFRLVPQCIHLVEVRVARRLAALAQTVLDVLESRRETTVRGAQRGLGIDAVFARQAHRGEEQIADLVLERAGSPTPRRGRSPRAPRRPWPARRRRRAVEDPPQRRAPRAWPPGSAPAWRAARREGAGAASPFPELRPLAEHLPGGLELYVRTRAGGAGAACGDARATSSMLKWPRPHRARTGRRSASVDRRAPRSGPRGPLLEASSTS